MALAKQPRILRYTDPEWRELKIDDVNRFMSSKSLVSATEMYYSLNPLYYAGYISAQDMTPEMVCKLGLRINESGDLMCAAAEMIRLARNNSSFDGNYINYDSVLKYDGVKTVTFSKDFLMGPYVYHLSKCVEAYDRNLITAKEVRPWRLQLMLSDRSLTEDFEKRTDAIGARLTLTLNNIESERAYSPQVFLATADAIINLHLANMHNVCIKGLEHRFFECTLTELWWVFLHNLDICSIGKCDVCDRPFLAKPTRANVKRYCGEACKQWRKKNPCGKRYYNTDVI